MACVASFTMWHTSMVHHCQMSTSSNHPIHAIPALEATQGHKIPFFKLYIVSLIEISTFKRKSRRSFTPCISFTIASSDCSEWVITWGGPLTNSWRQVYQSFICFNHSSNATANQTSCYLEGGLSRSRVPLQPKKWQTSQWGMKPSPQMRWVYPLLFLLPFGHFAVGIGPPLHVHPTSFFFYSLGYVSLWSSGVDRLAHTLPLGPFRFIGHPSWQATTAVRSPSSSHFVKFFVFVWELPPASSII